MRAIALALMAASGFAGLGYQIVWTQQFGLVLGHESAAVLAVVAAFFGGLSLGALWLGRRIEASAAPLRWYAGCEALIGIWGAVLMAIMPAASGAALQLIGPDATPLWQWSVAFGASLLLLLPATAAMGATLPAMARLGTAGVAPLYAANTLGAVAGVLATAFWLIPDLGLTRSAGLCVGLNLGCAALAGMALRSRPMSPCPPPRPDGALWRLAATGLLGIGYEVLAVRVLSQVAEDTVYTFALLLAVYLAGSALGAAAFARWHRLRDRAALLQALAASVLLGMAALWGAEALKQALLTLLPPTLASALAAEALLAMAVFALPTLLMGALFCQLSAEAANAGQPFSRALGVNTLGAMAAAPLFGVVLAPALGPKSALLLVAAGYLLLAPAWRRASWWAPAGAAVAIALLAPPLAFIALPDGGHLLSYRDGPMAAVSVVEDADGVARLRINNRQQEGSSATVLVDGRQALLPLLLHGAPQRALFLGVGSGVTSGVAGRLPGLSVDAVELLPEVIEATALFRPALASVGAGPAPRLIAADARRYVRTAAGHYDVIVSDNFHPARSGSGALYTVEHFRAVRERLAPQGVFCQWLPLHQLDVDTLRSITAAFLQAFPDGAALLASNSLDTPTLGLVGRAGGTRFSAGTTKPDMATPFGLGDDLAVLGSFIADNASLRRLAADAPINTDDRPWVAYRAPRVTYAPETTPRDRLLNLLAQVSVETTSLLTRPDLAPRLDAYARARHAYLDLGRRTAPSADPAVMLTRVGAPLLAVLRQSPDFQPAAEPLRRLARALAARDPAAARELGEALASIRPDLAP
ncbi:spermidine synthase [Pelomonas cellulosilytica]|uniref:Spermidine synthase n=1 Tax=Pelomonas cellulosilytica TaxID=2906762 RepID=A0ABS8XTH1_9BURK|nr:spermidine synthase [Pelomonas sp. P8]MCE4555173.1 spermidine synthase [Pelomonas sp. P8]